MTVTVAQPIYKTNVYHTSECVNCDAIRNPREMTQDRAERLGLYECVHCTQRYDQAESHATEYTRVLRESNTIEELREEVNASSISD